MVALVSNADSLMITLRRHGPLLIHLTVYWSSQMVALASPASLRELSRQKYNCDESCAALERVEMYVWVCCSMVSRVISPYDSVRLLRLSFGAVASDGMSNTSIHPLIKAFALSFERNEISPSAVRSNLSSDSL